MAETDAREARRKRIMDRGSDRLAFITGATPLTPRSALLSTTPRSAPASLTEENLSGFELSNKNQANNQSDTIEKDGEKEQVQKEEAADEVVGEDPGNGFSKCKMGKEFRKRGTSGTNDEIIDSSQNEDMNTESLTTFVTNESSDRAVSTTDPPPKRSKVDHQFFSCNRISRSISATENIRILCAITIALVGVLFGGGGGFASSLFSFRPLLLVLLTDATVVLGNIQVKGRGDPYKAEAEAGAGATKVEGESSEFDMGKALEVGLVTQQALRATFMDCSICAVIMICGLAV